MDPNPELTNFYLALAAITVAIASIIFFILGYMFCKRTDKFN